MQAVVKLIEEVIPVVRVDQSTVPDLTLKSIKILRESICRKIAEFPYFHFLGYVRLG